MLKFWRRRQTEQAIIQRDAKYHVVNYSRRIIHKILLRMMHIQFLIVTKLIFNEYFMSRLNSYSIAPSANCYLLAEN